MKAPAASTDPRLSAEESVSCSTETSPFPLPVSMTPGSRELMESTTAARMLGYRPSIAMSMLTPMTRTAKTENMPV